jgi:flagellar hook-associated protein 2
MSIGLTGLGGFDPSGVIAKLVEIAEKPLVEIGRKRALVDSASVTMNAFSKKLSSLKSAATALSTAAGFSSMSVSSSDGAVVASVSGASSPASYTVEVTRLAQAQKIRGDAQASATAALGQAGTLTIQVGAGDPVVIDVVETDSLAGVASKIGRSGARVSAAVINAGGSYYLSIQGLDTGAANAFTIAEGGSVSLGLSSPSSVVAAAQDAELSIDGLAVTRPTNQITEAIPGVTLALTSTTSGPVTIQVKSDAAALQAKIEAFVSAFNDVVNAGHTAAGYGTTKASNAVLAADSGIRRALDRIARIVSGPVEGASASFGSLVSVGISLTRDGTMQLNMSKLDAALKKDPEAVRRLFVTDKSSDATGVMKTLADAIDALVTREGGAVKGRIDALSAESRRLAESRAQKEKGVKDYEQQLRRQFSALDLAMSRYQSLFGLLGGIGTNAGTK